MEHSSEVDRLLNLELSDLELLLGNGSAYLPAFSGDGRLNALREQAEALGYQTKVFDQAWESNTIWVVLSTYDASHPSVEARRTATFSTELAAATKRGHFMRTQTLAGQLAGCCAYCRARLWIDTTISPVLVDADEALDEQCPPGLLAPAAHPASSPFSLTTAHVSPGGDAFALLLGPGV